MTVTEIWVACIGGTCILGIIGSCIKIKPLEINLWAWILRKLGKAFQGEMLDAIKGIGNEVNDLKDDVKSLQAQMDRHESKDLQDKILAKRRDILEFSDEIYREQKHSKEHFEEILSLIDDYEKYCSEHDKFENNKAVIAIQRIKDVYQDCLENHKFL